MDSSLENCREMSNFMEQTEKSAQFWGSEDAYSRKRSSPEGFQRADNDDFSMHSDKKTASHEREKPSYRRINRYFKSNKEYWKERNRRKQARQLHSEGYTYKQIAEKLGVSERTIQRDMNKTKSYRKSQMNKILREFLEEQQRQLLKQMKNMSLVERFRFLTEKIINHQNLMKIRDYRKHTLTLTINLDEILNSLNDQHYGRPLIMYSPKTLNCRLSELRLKFRFKKGEQIIPPSTMEFHSCQR